MESRKALAPSLRQYELDQVQWVTAPRMPAVSQSLAGTPQVTPATWTMSNGRVNRAMMRVLENVQRCRLVKQVRVRPKRCIPEWTQTTVGA